MAQEARPFDTTNMPELSQLVREVARTGQPRLLRADGDAALLSPAEQAANIALLRQEAFLTELTLSVTGAATHPEDDRTLATALSADAQFLLTTDDDPAYDSQQYQPFLQTRGYRRINRAAFGKTFSGDGYGATTG